MQHVENAGIYMCAGTKGMLRVQSLTWASRIHARPMKCGVMHAGDALATTATVNCHCNMTPGAGAVQVLLEPNNIHKASCNY